MSCKYMNIVLDATCNGCPGVLLLFYMPAYKQITVRLAFLSYNMRMNAKTNA